MFCIYFIFIIGPCTLVSFWMLYKLLPRTLATAKWWNTHCGICGLSIALEFVIGPLWILAVSVSLPCLHYNFYSTTEVRQRMISLISFLSLFWLVTHSCKSVCIWNANWSKIQRDKINYWQSTSQSPWFSEGWFAFIRVGKALKLRWEVFSLSSIFNKSKFNNSQ